MKLHSKKTKIFKIAMLFVTLFSLNADENDDDYTPEYFEEWNPDITHSADFGTGMGKDKTFAFDDPILTSPPPPISSKILAADDTTPPTTQIAQNEAPPRTILINFNNVAITEFIKFISRTTGKNFVYDESDLQFNVTIVSDEPATLDNVMAALMQILRIHNLLLMEQGNNIIIHTNPKVNSISKVVSDGQLQLDARDTEIVTQVFRLNSLSTERAQDLITPLISVGAVVTQIPDSSNIVVTDIAVNVQKIGQLLKSLDSPASGLILGQYQVTSAFIDSLIPLAEKIMAPIAETKPIVFVPHIISNSIFIVSTPFLVERSIAVLRNLDVNTGQTRIFSNESLKFNPNSSGGYGMPGYDQGGLYGSGPGYGPGSPDYIPGQEGQNGVNGLPGGLPNAGGSLSANPNFPNENSGFAGGNQSVYGQLNADGSRNTGGLSQGALSTQSQLQEIQRRQGFRGGAIGGNNSWTSSLPLGHIQRTQFYIQKLRYRRGDQIVLALQSIADSLQKTGQTNVDLVSTIQSIQWIEASNSLVFTGTSDSLLKVRELIAEIDTALRQVFIEMLILETTIDDSLTYGVNWGARFGGGNTSASEAFISKANPLAGLLDTAGFATNSNVLNRPDASNVAQQAGYSLGIIGRRLTKGGTEYASLGGLVKAIHEKSKSNIVMNPKILTEDNVPAELFVGINTRFQTQSIANDQGRLVTNNYEFRDVGTTLKVTPLLSNTDIVTLEIKQEVSRVLPNSDTGGGGIANVPAGPSTSKNTTTTRVHVPNKYFLIISGMIQEQRDRDREQVPCLGGAPVIGALFSEKSQTDAKRNLMIFIRPEIIDTEEQIEHLTRHQQNLYRQKMRQPKMWQMETDEAMDWMNLQKPDNCYNDREEFNP